MLSLKRNANWQVRLRHLIVTPLLAATALAMAWAPPAPAASKPQTPSALRWQVSGPVGSTGDIVAGGPTSRRHLIVIPGGGFTFHDRGFWPAIAPKAIAAGFEPHFLAYRLYDLEGAIADARAMARALSARYGRAKVFAYGSSAGGTLATLLAARGEVSAAVSSSGLYDLRHWPWATEYRGDEYLHSIGASWEVRQRVSPVRHRLRCPALLLHGSWDPVVPVTQALDFEATRPRARLRLYPGGHGLYRARPASVYAAIRWLARTARRQGVLDQRLQRGARTAGAARRILCA